MWGVTAILYLMSLHLLITKVKLQKKLQSAASAITKKLLIDQPIDHNISMLIQTTAYPGKTVFTIGKHTYTERVLIVDYSMA